MKKITFIALSLILTYGYSQNASSFVDIAGDDFETQVLMPQDFNRDPCSQSTPSNAFENGHGNLHLLLVANDFNVAADETLTLEELKLNVINNNTINSADIYIYEDLGAGPGVELSADLAQPVTVTNVGTAFGFNVDEVAVDLSTLDIALDGGPAGATYWVGVLISYNGASSFWEGTSVINTDNEGYLFLDGAWAPISVVFTSDPFDGVMELSGDCSPTLSLNDNLLSQIAIYPSPATDVLNIKVPSGVEVNSAVVYDILGKNTGATYSNGIIDVSNLSRGIYILTLNTNEGSLTQRIVKK